MLRIRNKKTEIDTEKDRNRMRIREKNWCNSKALGQRTDCRGAMVDTRKELLLHRESEWCDR